MRPAVWSLLVLAMWFSGCVSDDAPGGVDGTPDMAPEPLEPQIIEWDGHITLSQLDFLAHMKDPEAVLWPIQQAGFLVEIDEAPDAIEVMVSWEASDAGFRLHPHYTAEYDPALGGDTLYYGYHSEMFTESPGCIRIPAKDMAAGTWPMMIHPRSGTMDVDYTITVGILGANGTVLPEMHGHRTDGASPVEDHGVEPCQFLGIETPAA